MTVLSATTAELKRLDAVGSPEGQCALALARAVDSGKSLMAAPAMVKELAAQLRAIRDATPVRGDAVDDVLGAYREAKGGAAKPAGVVRTTQRKRGAR